MEWLAENWLTIVITAIIAAIFLAIVIKGILNKKSGKSGCGCGCEHCTNAQFCHPEKTK